MKNINEAISDKVYHYTEISNAYHILKTGTVNLTPTIKNQSERKHGFGKFYFLSLTRSRRGEFHHEKPLGVLFSLDGRKLNQNYKGKAIDYFAMKNQYGMPTTDEMEDRLVTDKSFIEIIPYVKELSILISDKEIYARQMYYVPALVALAKRNNIPVYVYNNSSDFIKSEKKNALSLQEIKEYSREKPRSYSMSRIDFNKDGIDAIIELYHKNDKEQLTKHTREYYRMLISSFGKKDLITSIYTDIQNKTGQQGLRKSYKKTNVEKLINLMKKNKVRRLEDFIEIVKKKWDDIENQEFKNRFKEQQRDKVNSINKMVNDEKEFDASEFHPEGDPEIAANSMKNIISRMIEFDIELEDIKSKYKQLFDSGESKARIATKIARDLSGEFIF